MQVPFERVRFEPAYERVLNERYGVTARIDDYASLTAPTGTFGACYIRGDPHQESVADWLENYADSCENVPRVGKLRTWRLAHNEELFTPAEKRTSRMYNEFQPKYDCGDQVAVVVDRPSDDRRLRDRWRFDLRHRWRR